MYNKVEICGVNTATLKVLTEAEKIHLLQQMQQGHKQAREQLVQGNLRLVLSVVQRFAGRGENPDDLFQVGCIGLIKSIDNFDLSQNVRFSTYAVPMIIGEIRRYLRDNNAIRISRSMRDIAYRAMQAKEQLLSENKREPTINEIAEQSSVCIDIEESLLPVHESVRNGCSFLGLDPLYLANEGKCICILPQDRAEAALRAMRTGLDMIAPALVSAGAVMTIREEVIQAGIEAAPRFSALVKACLSRL